MALTIEVDPRHVLNAEEKLALLMLPRRKRIWILKTLGRWEKQNARKRIRAQKDPDGKAWEKRKAGKGKMLKRMAKGLVPYVKQGTDLELKHRSRLSGRIAARHHTGQSQQMTAAKMKKYRGEPDYDAPCSRGQARRLRELGYKVRRKRGKGWKRPSLKELMTTLTVGRAGAIIRELSHQPDKTSWDIPLPKRQFLGSDEREVNRELIRLLEQARKRN